jgi:L-amino acid N-acyltransferase YncA
MNIIVRSITVDDYEQVRNVEKNSHLVSRKPEFQINVDTGYCFLAENKNKNIIGFLMAHETLPFHGTLYVRYIGVKPEAQGQGVGQLLYKKLIETAKQTGIKKIIGLANVDNPSSIKLFEKVGFKLSDRKQAVLELSKED